MNKFIEKFPVGFLLCLHGISEPPTSIPFPHTPPLFNPAPLPLNYLTVSLSFHIDSSLYICSFLSISVSMLELGSML